MPNSLHTFSTGYGTTHSRSGIEYQLCDASCDETELYQSIDAFPRFDSVLVKPEVLLGIPKSGLNQPSLPIVSNYLT